jgi:hypothetical protein
MRSPLRRSDASSWTSLAFLLILATVGVSRADDLERKVDESLAEQTSPVELLIVKSTPKYDEARRVAENAAQRLGIPLKLRGLMPHDARGLSLPKQDCDALKWDYPCYLARGRYDEGEYVSIEHSSAYDELAPDLYVVVAASCLKGDPETKRMRPRAKPAFPDAYVRTVDVYFGCMQ